MVALNGPKPRPRGILCPACAVPLTVVRTTSHAGVIKRRRACPQCGTRVTTQERRVAPAANSTPAANSV